MDTSFLKKSKVLGAIHRLSARIGGQPYLVGGAVRDFLLGRPLGKDFDFVAQGDVSGLAKAVAQEMGGHAFVLDESFGTWRVILKKRKGKSELDFSSMQGEDIVADLKQRDFTINSIALSLKEIFSRESLPFIDPLGGQSDLGRKIIRANSEKSLRQDPLRMLRAFRFASTLGFSVEEDTLAMIGRNKRLLLRAAWERIRSEFFMSLGENQAGHFLRRLNQAGLLTEIFPEVRGWDNLPQGAHFSLLEHSIRTVEGSEFILGHAEDLYSSLAQGLRTFFCQTVEEGISRVALLKFVAFFHDSGKPGSMTWVEGDPYPRFLDHDREGERVNTAIARRMNLSRRSIRIISGLTRHHMRLQSLSRAEELTSRAKYRFFRDLGKEGIDLIFLAFGNALASKRIDFHSFLSSGPAAGDLFRIKRVGGELLRFYYDEFSRAKSGPLLDGKEVMEALGISPGKAVGALLEKLREEEMAGRVETREEALKFLKDIDRSA